MSETDKGFAGLPERDQPSNLPNHVKINHLLQVLSLRQEIQGLSAEVARLTGENAAMVAPEERDQWKAEAERLTAALEAWKLIACLFHDAEVGSGNAGMFNQKLCSDAMRLMDVQRAKEGDGHPEDIAVITAEILGAEAKLTALRSALTSLRNEMQDWRGSVGGRSAEQIEVWAHMLNTLLVSGPAEAPHDPE